MEPYCDHGYKKKKRLCLLWQGHSFFVEHPTQHFRSRSFGEGLFLYPKRYYHYQNMASQVLEIKSEFGGNLDAYIF